jgi:hypothetical protein
VQDEIMAQVMTIPHVDFYRGEREDEDTVAVIPGTDVIQPYVTISFGGKVKPRVGTNGIVGAAQATYLVTIVARAVASTERTSEQVLELVESKLIGFKPTGCGEIEHALYGGTGEASSLGNPSRSASVQAYTLLINP